MSEPACWELDWSEVSVLDRNAISLGLNEWDLMNSAADQLVKEISNFSTSTDVLFLCGPGNNGGDGFVAAKKLLKIGWNVGIISSHNNSKTTISCRARDEVRDKVEICIWPEVPDFEYPLIIDCLLGSGSSGYGETLRSPLDEIVIWAKSKTSNIIACDIPTGLGGPSALTANKTVTFHSIKKYLHSKDAGEVIISPLAWTREVEDCGIGDIMRYPKIRKNAKKGDRGRLLVIGGGPYHGAPILAGMAAARSGCDLVTIAMPSKAMNRVSWPNSLIPLELPDLDILSPQSFDKIITYIKSNKIDSIVIGPGLGNDDLTKQVTLDILIHSSQNKIPTVVDADAISAMPTKSWIGGLIGVATPHKKEASNWLKDMTPKKALSRTEGEEAVIVVTGSVDELTGSQGRYCFARGGNPRMSVGGTGDLLAGIIGGLMAQGMNPWPSARLGCSVLREAGSKESKNSGPGMIADDVVPQIAKTISEWMVR